MKFAWRMAGALTVLCCISPLQALTPADYVDFSLRDPRGNVILPGRLYVPPSVLNSPHDRHPMMTMLHGGGGRGTDNLAQLIFASDGMIQAAEERGALLYLPQTTENWTSSAVTGQVMTMIDRAIDDWNVEIRQSYMLGYSNGGGGVWNMLSRYDGRIAAALSISGITPGSDFVAARLVDTPIIALHARDDATVSMHISRNVINGILSAGNERLPTYLPLSDPATLMISNADLESHRILRGLAHELGLTTDVFLADPKHDLLYIETALGGHTGLLGALNSDEIYDWMFSHTTVPEPSSLYLLMFATALVSYRWRFAGKARPS